MLIHALDPHDVTRAGVWYAALRAGASAGRVAPPVVSEYSLLTSLRTNDSNTFNDRRAYGAWDDDSCLGACVVTLPRGDNRHLVEIEINVPPEHRRRGTGGALFDHVLGIARAEHRTTVTNEVDVNGVDAALASSDGGRFALARGFAVRNTERRLMLDIPVPDEGLAGLDLYARERAAGYRAVSWLGLTPDEWLGSHARMHTLMGQDVPRGDSDREPLAYDADRLRSTQTRSMQQGYGIVTTLVIDDDGAPAAYTKMLVNPDGAHVLQDETFVLRAHRGHRLGTLAKVANLRVLAAHHPQARHVHTWTAEVNDAMRSINERFGFREVETMYEVELSL